MSMQKGVKPIDRTAFQRVIGTFPTGITIISTIDHDRIPYGLTANSFTSVSLDPPLILVCLDHQSKSRSVDQGLTSFCSQYIERRSAGSFEPVRF